MNATKKITNITVAVLQLLKYSSEQYLPYSHILDNISENKATLKCFDYNQAYNQACTRTVPFLVVPGRSWNEHDQKSNLERNDPEQGTTRFQKNGNEWNEVVPGTRSFLVVPRVRAQHRNGIFRVRTTLCQNEI